MIDIQRLDDKTGCVKTIDFSTALALAALATLAFFGTRELPIWEDVSPGPRFMPVLAAAVAASVALGLFLHALSSTSAPGPVWPDAAGRRRVLLTATGIAGFLIINPLLGFVPSAAALVLFVLLAALRRGVFPSLVATAVTFSLIQGVFVSWLRVPLPKGPLGL